MICCILRQALYGCDFGIVAINMMASVKQPEPYIRCRTRGAGRYPSALDVVDMVVVFDEDTPIALLKEIKPDVLVKGGQYKLEEVVGYEIVMSYGGEILRATMEEGFSTTNMITRIVK